MLREHPELQGNFGEPSNTAEICEKLWEFFGSMGPEKQQLRSKSRSSHSPLVWRFAGLEKHCTGQECRSW